MGRYRSFVTAPLSGLHRRPPGTFNPVHVNLAGKNSGETETKKNMNNVKKKTGCLGVYE